MVSKSSKILHDLGLQATENIRIFEVTREEKYINGLFRILLRMGGLINLYEYRKVRYHVRMDSVHQVTEDILFRVYRNPENFSHLNNFFFYYYTALRYSIIKIVRHLHYQNLRIVHLDTYDDLPEVSTWGHGYIPPPDYLWRRRDNCKLLIYFVTLAIKAFPRFRDRRKFLIWLIITYMMQEDKAILADLEFRDRTALRALVQVVSFKVSHNAGK